MYDTKIPLTIRFVIRILKWRIPTKNRNDKIIKKKRRPTSSLFLLSLFQFHAKRKQ